jgi:hypothetical protein
LHNKLQKNTFYTTNVHNLPYLPLSTTENNRTSGLKYQKVHQITTTVGSNTSTTKYKVVSNKLLNNGKLITTGRHSTYISNDHGTDNTASRSNKSTMNYKVVPNNLLNNGKGLTTRRRAIYMANDRRIKNTVFQGNISAPINQGEISANQGEISAMKKKKTKTMDINEANYKMGHRGEVALRKLLNHHNIKATGKFENCVSCMKWKAQNKRVSKTALNPEKYPGERLHIDARGPLPLPMGRKQYWLKIRDEYSGYSWDYFMSEKSTTTAILKRQLQWMKASGMRVKLLDVTMQKNK